MGSPRFRGIKFNIAVSGGICKLGDPVLVRYLAVRGKNGKYLGTLECVQNMAFAKKHFEG